MANRNRLFDKLYNTNGWTPLIGYDCKYLVKESGHIYSPYFRAIIPGQIDKEGYLLVTLRKNGKLIKRRIHRIIAEVFIPNPLNKPQVNHNDFDKTNNCVSNLIWATSQEDANHKVSAGRQAKGSSFPVRKGRKLNI